MKNPEHVADIAAHILAKLNVIGETASEKEKRLADLKLPEGIRAILGEVK